MKIVYFSCWFSPLVNFSQMFNITFLNQCPKLHMIPRFKHCDWLPPPFDGITPLPFSINNNCQQSWVCRACKLSMAIVLYNRLKWRWKATGLSKEVTARKITFEDIGHWSIQSWIKGNPKSFVHTIKTWFSLLHYLMFSSKCD